MKEEGEGEVGGRGREGAGIYLGPASLPDHTVPSDTAALGQTPPRPPLIYHTLPLSLPCCPYSPHPLPTHHTLCPLIVPFYSLTHSLTRRISSSFPSPDQNLSANHPQTHPLYTEPPHFRNSPVHYSLKRERTISWRSEGLTDSST